MNKNWLISTIILLFIPPLFFGCGGTIQLTEEIDCIYLVPKEGGLISQKVLDAHPEILVVHSSNELISLVPVHAVGVILDISSLKDFDKEKYKKTPFYNYPTIVAGEANAEYALELVGMESQKGISKNHKDGYSLLWWLGKSEVPEKVSLGYEKPITIENISNAFKSLTE